MLALPAWRRWRAGPSDLHCNLRNFRRCVCLSGNFPQSVQMASLTSSSNSATNSNHAQMRNRRRVTSSLTDDTCNGRGSALSPMAASCAFLRSKAAVNGASSCLLGLDGARGDRCTRPSPIPSTSRARLTTAQQMRCVLYTALVNFSPLNAQPLRGKGCAHLSTCLCKLHPHPVWMKSMAAEGRPRIAASQSGIGSLQYTANPTAINLARRLR